MQMIPYVYDTGSILTDLGLQYLHPVPVTGQTDDFLNAIESVITH